MIKKMILTILFGLSFEGFCQSYDYFSARNCAIQLDNLGRIHATVCAQHKSDKKKDFCEGDIVHFKGSKIDYQVVGIKNKLVFGIPIINKSYNPKGAVILNVSNVTISKHLKCMDRKMFLNKVKNQIRRFHFSR